MVDILHNDMEENSEFELVMSDPFPPIKKSAGFVVPSTDSAL